MSQIETQHLNFDLIIFDCDGTLVDSETLNNQATIDVLISLGIKDYTLEHSFLHWMGTTYTSIGLRVQEETGKELPEDFTQRCVARVAELQENEVKPVEGALDIVRALEAKAIKSCIASNGERTNVLNSVRLTGLSKHYPEDKVFTKIQVARPKPAPDLFLYAAEKMNAAPIGCLVIEDSEAGVAGAAAAGMKVLGFTGTSHDPQMQAERLIKAGASDVFQKLIHIQEMLGV